MSETAQKNRWILLAIALAVLVWGAYHALGAYLFNHNPWRAVMVLACVGGYLGIWGLLLMRRKARIARAAKDE